MTETLEPSALEQAAKAVWELADDEVGWEASKADPKMAAQIEWVRSETEAAISVYLAALASSAPQPVAWLDVLAERQRQVSAEGWTVEHDDEHDDFSLAKAAAVYALGAAEPRTERAVMDEFGNAGTRHHLLKMWPWDEKWWKPKSRRGDLVKAAALLLAEIERLDRAK